MMAELRIFCLFHINISNRRGLTCCLFYSDGKSCPNKYADKLKRATAFNCMGDLSHIPYAS